MSRQRPALCQKLFLRRGISYSVRVQDRGLLNVSVRQKQMKRSDLVARRRIKRMLSRGKVQLPYCTRPADTQVMESDWKGYEEHDTRVICTCKERVVITHNHMPAPDGLFPSESFHDSCSMLRYQSLFAMTMHREQTCRLRGMAPACPVCGSHLPACSNRSQRQRDSRGLAGC